MINWLLNKFFKKKTEIQYVEAALKRYRNELFDLSSDFDHTRDCCVTCMTGGYDERLRAKIDRVEKWLAILKKRKGIV